MEILAKSTQETTLDAESGTIWISIQVKNISIGFEYNECGYQETDSLKINQMPTGTIDTLLERSDVTGQNTMHLYNKL